MSVILGDCLEVMATLDAESIDAICTDPPYDHLSASRNGSPRRNLGKPGNPFARHDRGGAAGGFMGKAWDGTGIAFDPATWAACLRVAKPGAYLLAFGGTRTVHRMTCAIEDAGWIIRDMLVWGYASGFPKGRANLKPAWEPIVMARKPGPLRMLAIDLCRIGVEGGGGNGLGSHFGQATVPRVQHGPDEVDTLGRWPANVILTDPIFDGGWDGVVGGGEASYNPAGVFGRQQVDQPTDTAVPFAVRREGDGIFGYGDSGTYSRFFLIPKSSRSDREPVLGGLPPKALAIGAHRAGMDEEHEDFVYPAPEGIGTWLRQARLAAGMSGKELTGRIGAHGAVNHGGAVSNWEQELNRPTPEQWRALRDVLGFDDRYDEAMTSTQMVPSQFMQITAPSRRANNHPTVKPVDLMRHLIRLVTPQGGTVLDPFGGSGTTALAAEMEGFDWILIEKEAEYVAIAEARLNGTQKGMAL